MTRVVVIGAGIYGAAVAHEVVRRGADAVLIDRGDLAGEASSNSMKVAHGGLRYLQSVDLPRFFESVRERRRWLRRVPDHVVPQAFRMHLDGRSPTYRAAFRAGLALNDVLSAARNRGVLPSRTLSAAQYPVWYDGAFHDTERVLLALLHTAARRGKGSLEVVTHDGVNEILQRGSRATGARLESGRVVSGDWVVQCTGGHPEGARAVLAMNLVVPPLALGPPGEATGFFHPDDGRNVFVLPWRGVSIVGTWNSAFGGDPSEPLVVGTQQVEDMLRWLAPVHPAFTALGREHVFRVHAGLLPREPGGQAADPARHFRIEQPAPGLVEVVGVKWTTAWAVAERAVELALGPGPEPEIVPLDDGLSARERYIAAEETRARPLGPASAGLRAGDVGFAIEHEWARHLEDVLLRRTATATAGHPGRGLVEAAALAAQPLLDWSEPERMAEVEAFHDDPTFVGNVPD